MPWSADIVIVGSGVAGSLVATRLARAGLKVVILEAGPRVQRGAALAQYRDALIKIPESPYPDTPYAPHPVSDNPDHYYLQDGPDKFASPYLRQVGGTTWHWLGTTLRFVPDDFRLRSRFGVGVDWPISYDDLEPWYCEAERELGVAGDPNADLNAPRSQPYPLPPIPLSYADQRTAAALAGHAVHGAADTAGAKLAALRQPARVLRQQQLHSDLSGAGEVRRDHTRRAGRTRGRAAGGRGDRFARRGWRRWPHHLAHGQAPGWDGGSRDRQGVRDRRARHRDAEVAAAVADRASAWRRGEFERSGRPQPDGSPIATEMGARRRTAGCVPRTVVDGGHRVDARGRLAGRSRRVQDSTRQSRMGVADGPRPTAPCAI